MWQILLGTATGLLLTWLALVIVLLLVSRRYQRPGMAGILRSLPDLLRLLRRLAGDASLPRGVRIGLWLLLAYLVLPIDVVPDFIPLIGYADDAIVIAIALRSVVRRAGTDVVARHWPGTEAGLTVVLRAAGLDPPTT